jgi:hypothetical protein
MELSIFLAQLFGLTIMIFAGLVFFRPGVIDEAISSLRPNSFSSVIAGFVGIVAGLAVILSHNIWEMNWRGLVTLFGWASLIKGITYMAFPDRIISMAKNMMNSDSRKIVLAVTFFLGLYLAYQGFNY